MGCGVLIPTTLSHVARGRAREGLRMGKRKPQTAAQIEADHHERRRTLQKQQELHALIEHLQRALSARQDKRGGLWEALAGQSRAAYQAGIEQARYDLSWIDFDIFCMELRDFRCGAKTRGGGVCQRSAITGKRRCALHGGKSSGPLSEAGREAIRESNRRRAANKASVSH